MKGDADIKAYQGFQKNPPDIVVPNGTNVRVYDFAPGFETAMHRTLSIDYGVVLEGQIDAVMDSGEVRTLSRGDLCIQRGTNHAWRNPSKSEWARVMYFVVAADPLVTKDGKTLEANKADHSSAEREQESKL